MTTGLSTEWIPVFPPEEKMARTALLPSLERTVTGSSTGSIPVYLLEVKTVKMEKMDKTGSLPILVKTVTGISTEKTPASLPEVKTAIHLLFKLGRGPITIGSSTVFTLLLPLKGRMG